MSVAEFHLEADSKVCRIVVVGKIVDRAADELCEFAECCSDRAPGALCLDFSHVEQLDSRAVGLLIQLRRLLLNRDIMLRLEHVPHPIDAILGQMGLRDLLQVTVLKEGDDVPVLEDGPLPHPTPVEF